MHPITQPHPTFQPQILTFDVDIIPIGDTGLDLRCRRFDRLERGWRLLLTPEEYGAEVRFRIHTAFTAGVPYKLHTVKIRDAGQTTLAVTDGPTYTLPLMVAGDELMILDLVAEPQQNAQKPKRRGGGNLILRDAN